MSERMAWIRIEEVIGRRDPHCRGVLLLGLSAPHEELVAGFLAVAGIDIVKGFAIGRTIWQDPAERWLRGEIDDAQAIELLAANFAALVHAWRAARQVEA